MSFSTVFVEWLDLVDERKRDVLRINCNRRTGTCATLEEVLYRTIAKIQSRAVSSLRTYSMNFAGCETLLFSTKISSCSRKGGGAVMAVVSVFLCSLSCLWFCTCTVPFCVLTLGIILLMFDG